MPRPFPKHPSYEAVIRGLLRMHRFTNERQDESEEADSLRETMSEPWGELSKVERERVTGLSRDLYAISDHEAQAAEPMNPQAQGKLNEAYEARQRGEWDKALELLRRWGKHAPASLVSYLRGTVWYAAGDAATAAVFFEHASHLDPQNENFQAVLLFALKTADPEAAAVRAGKILEESEQRAPSVVVYAADVAFWATRKMSEAESLPIYKKLMPILERTLSRMEGQEDIDRSALHGTVFLLLASGYEALGVTRTAYDWYSRAVQLDPTNDAILIARGVLSYGMDPNATADFEQAIQLDSPLVWPYFYLAHHYLVNNFLEECRSMCERALQRPAFNRVRSELYEFLAISMSGLGYPEPIVRRAFENAIRVDPSNDRARRNLEKFNALQSVHTPQSRDWDRPSESSMRKRSQEEVRRDPAFIERRQFALV